MQLTNKHSLPEPLLAAIKNDDYVKVGDISTTQLIDSPRIRMLKKKHWKDLTEDAIDHLWMLLGSAVHSVIERATKTLDEKRWLSEHQMTLSVKNKILSGKCDLFDTQEGILYDFKITSAFKLVYGEDFLEWQAQLNTYAYMLRKEGHTVNKIIIVAILKDWKRAEAEKNFDQQSKYPMQPVVQIELPVYTDEAMLKYINTRMDMHIDAEFAMTLPDCSDKERWHEDDVYAVMKTGNKRAVKLYDTEEEAKGYIQKSPTGTFIERRKGRDRRCESFCLVKDFCDQYKRNKENK